MHFSGWNITLSGKNKINFPLLVVIAVTMWHKCNNLTRKESDLICFLFFVNRVKLSENLFLSLNSARSRWRKGKTWSSGNSPYFIGMIRWNKFLTRVEADVIVNASIKHVIVFKNGASKWKVTMFSVCFDPTRTWSNPFPHCVPNETLPVSGYMRCHMLLPNLLKCQLDWGDFLWMKHCSSGMRIATRNIITQYCQQTIISDHYLLN
jgi:hypothetical protein